MIQIPITNQPNQSFEVVIPIGDINIQLSFFFFWNRIAGYWEMNVGNAATGESLIAGLPLITGAVPTENLLRQWEYLAIGSAYVVPITDGAADYPGENDWGVNYVLVWGP